MSTNWTAEAKKKECQADLAKHEKSANAYNMRIRGLRQTPKKQRAQRLEELQKSRRGVIGEYYLALEQFEQLELLNES